MPERPFLTAVRSAARRPARLAALAAVTLVAGTCGGDFADCGKRIVVIGIDGMDPVLLRQYMDEGVMPAFKALADEGTFVPLGTSNPPQSPVAWSNFITGMDPGGHGVFDFIHRDPHTYSPVSSTQITEGEPITFPLPGGYKIEIPPDSRPVRQGRPFWDVLADHGIRAEVYRIPAAYPIQDSEQLTLSDMGTPDLHGGIDGLYAWYTSDLPADVDKIAKGIWRLVDLKNGRTTDAVLYGPPSPFKRPVDGKPVPMSETPFTVYVDPERPVVHIEIEDGDSCVLEEGQWSEWLRCSFDHGLMQSMGGMVKFFLQRAHPKLRLYASPINIDPREPVMPISTPDDATEVMCEAIGPFYTQGLAEETVALQEGVISDAEFILQCDDVTAERMRMLDWALDRFHDGLLFFYFSSIDLRCHMMWRHIEPGHPARDEELAPMFAGSIRDAYVQMDGALARVREKLDRDTPIVVLSDHGFAPFTRKVNLNRWLMDEGYLVASAETVAEHANLAAQDPKAKTALSIAGSTIDRPKTRAYAVGFNGIYLNLKGRERDGVVEPSERDALLEEIRGKLLALEDEERGARPVRRVDRSSEIYHGEHLDAAPDLVVGYERGYGADDDTALGTCSLSARGRVIYDNKGLWCGSHLMAPEVVPGVFLTNRKLEPKDPDLCDLAATLLSYFGVGVPAEMRGTSLF